MSLGTEAGNAKIMGWAYEMAAWFALTQGDYRGVIVASEAGREIAGGHSVTVQSPSSSLPKKPKHGHASATAAKSKSR